MPRTFAVERTVYSFAELSDRAKEHAREQHSRFLWECGDMQERCQDIFTDYLEELGWEGADSLTFSLYSQGGEPCFSADIPALELEGCTFYVTLRPRHSGGGHYYFEANVDLGDGFEEPDYGTPAWDAHLQLLTRAEEHALDLARDVSSELTRRFEAEDAYLSSEEEMTETSEANGYEYDENGDLA